MADEYRVGIIGCGRKPGPGPDGRMRGGGIAENHAKGYAAHGRTRIVAAADISQENLASFQERHQVAAGYLDYHEMLAKEHLDIVSICTWVGLHSQICVDAANSKPKGILCEKPMALTLPDADAMLEACARNNVAFTIDHQRRLGRPFALAKDLLQGGRIGQLLRLEGYVPGGNLLDWGTHWIDMFFFYQDQAPVEWVMAMADRQTERSLFGVEVEDHSITHYQFRNGVRAYIELGVPIKGQPANRLIGSDGIIEVGVANGPNLRVRGNGDRDWVMPDMPEGIHGMAHFEASVAELVTAVEEGREPRNNGANGRQALEVILAGYESIYRRAKVSLPLTITDNPIARLAAAWKAG
ncbi:MAG: Gfo/Idh/MocA family protein [Chloroflexota bacterium]